MNPALPFESQFDKFRKGGVKVLVVSGGSGGHIFPAISFLRALKIKHDSSQNILVVPQRSAQIPEICEDFTVKYISIYPVNLSFTRSNLKALLNLVRGALESLGLLLDFKPDVVVGFGGLESIPLILFAWLFRIKTLIHEQNVLPGRANRLLVKFSDKIAVSFIETKKFLSVNENRIIFTGNPVFQRMEPLAKKEALDYFGFSENRFTILVIGGSQGSHSINLAFLDAVSYISRNLEFQVIHITGSRDFEFMKEKYKYLNLGLNLKLFSFLKEMRYAYSASDVVVTRSGATTIAEVMVFKIPAIIIPYPFAYKHQSENAKILERLGASVVIEDNQTTGLRLRKALDDFVNDPAKIKTMRHNFSNCSLKLNAADLLVDIALQ